MCGFDFYRFSITAERKYSYLLILFNKQQMQLLKIILWVTVGFLVVFVLYKFYRCREKGDESGKAFCCSLFSSEPTWLTALSTYNTMRQGKCYEITDYGRSMSFRRIELEMCVETAGPVKQESLAEYELIDE